MDANDFLMGGGVKSASFPDGQFGTSVEGPIVREPELRQQTDFDDGKPKFYDNGDPMMQIVVHVQTNKRDDELDDGVRAFYIKSQMMAAVRTAVRAAGAQKLEPGGRLRVTYVRDEPNSRGRGKDKKIYEAKYAPPVPGQAANDVLMGNGTSAAPAARPQMAPVSGSRQLTEAEQVTLDRLRAKQANATVQAEFGDNPPF